MSCLESNPRRALSDNISCLPLGDGRLAKIALVHDWLTGMRGGEKVLEALCELFPSAPLFTLLHIPGSVSRQIEEREIVASPLQHCPLSSTKYRHYLPLYPIFAELTKARGFDVVISTSHAVAKSMVGKDASGRPLHICYIHTPMRYVWDRFDDYFGAERVGKLQSGLIYRPVASLLRRYDRNTVPRVDVFVANSGFVADRVGRIYGRSAQVVHPPVDTTRFLSRPRVPGDSYLVVSALVPYKRVEQAIAACSALRRGLKIVGTGPGLKKLQCYARQLSAEVDFVGFVTDEELGAHYQSARALLFPGVEDFGIVPVEAIASGCPVIALAEGGILDSMTPDTAELYAEPTVDGLKRAILDFEAREFDERQLRDRAAQFSKTRFQERFLHILSTALLESQNNQ